MLGNAAGRRKFLKLLGATPIAAKVARDEAAQRLANGSPVRHATALMEQTGAYNYGDPPTATSTSPFNLTVQQRQALLTRALKVPSLRSELESLLYANNRTITHVDPDIAVLRSYSLMAKLTFQRQRDVQREIDTSVRGVAPWQEVENWANKLLKGVFGGLF